MATRDKRNWWPNEYETKIPVKQTDNPPAEQGGVEQDMGSLMDGIDYNDEYNVNYGQMDPNSREVQDEERAQWQLDQMLAQDGPLMQRAAAQGHAVAGQRGLMNSSLAAGAAQGAMIDRAKDFVLSDAEGYRKAASENLQSANMAGQTNAQLQTQANIVEQQLKGNMDTTRYSAEAAAVREESQRRWQTGENQDQRDWTTDENIDQRTWQSGENQLNRDWTSQENMEQRMLQWATAELTAYTNMYGSRMSAMGQVMANIYSHPDLSSEEQRAAWANAQIAFENLYGEKFVPPEGFPTYPGNNDTGADAGNPPPQDQPPADDTGAADPFIYTDPYGTGGSNRGKPGDRNVLHSQDPLMATTYSPPIYTGGLSFSSSYSPDVAVVMDGLPDV